MEQGFVNKFKTKVNQWFREPQGTQSASNSSKTESKKPFESFESSKSLPKQTRGRGDKREIPHRIEPFYPRGAAGRHESRGAKGPHKAAMPHQGSRPKYPK